MKKGLIGEENNTTVTCSVTGMRDEKKRASLYFRFFCEMAILWPRRITVDLFLFYRIGDFLKDVFRVYCVFRRKSDQSSANVSRIQNRRTQLGGRREGISLWGIPCSAFLTMIRDIHNPPPVWEKGIYEYGVGFSFYVSLLNSIRENITVCLSVRG